MPYDLSEQAGPLEGSGSTGLKAAEQFWEYSPSASTNYWDDRCRVSHPFSCFGPVLVSCPCCVQASKLTHVGQMALQAHIIAILQCWEVAKTVNQNFMHTAGAKASATHKTLQQNCCSTSEILHTMHAGMPGM